MRVVGGVLVVAALAVGLVLLVTEAPVEAPTPAPVDFADHAFPAVAWTGDRLLVYGGSDNGPDRYSSAAALIGQTTDRRRVIPPNRLIRYVPHP